MSDQRTRDCILFFVKNPVPGEVKTRLAEDSSPEGAAHFYAVFAEEKLVELADGCDGDVFVYYTPQTVKNAMVDWLGQGHRYLAQKGNSFGRRMENAFREVFFMGYERAILVVSDVPGLTPAIVTEGRDALTPETPVVGPAENGGYYCIAFHKKGFAPEVFRDVAGDTADTFQLTTNRLDSLGLKWVALPSLENTNTLEDVETLTALGLSGPLGKQALEAARKLVGV